MKRVVFYQLCHKACQFDHYLVAIGIRLSRDVSTILDGRRHATRAAPGRNRLPEARTAVRPPEPGTLRTQQVIEK